MSDSNCLLRRGAGVLCLLLFSPANYTADAAPPVVSNVRASQRPGTKLVDIYYDLADADSTSLSVSVAVSTDGGAIYGLQATSFSGSGYGPGVTPGSNKQIVWNAGTDWNGKFSANVRFRVTADDGTAPSGMVLIPAGSFTMGNAMNPNEGWSDELPLHTVYVSAFYMDQYDVTTALWDSVFQWAASHGYVFDLSFSGQGKAANHPAVYVSWYDAIKWCNARSEQEGRMPAYYTSAAQTTPCRTGQTNVQNDWVKWNEGYRLPTEAEWEKAARGGSSGRRFPWSDVDTISHGQANYDSTNKIPYSLWPPCCSYDLGPTWGLHPAFNHGAMPYTSPVGYFAPNGNGLYDMAGNVFQWCWDWYSGTYYSSSPTSDPRGPASGSSRMTRGGSFDNYAIWSRTSVRGGQTVALGRQYRIPLRSASRSARWELHFRRVKRDGGGHA